MYVYFQTFQVIYGNSGLCYNIAVHIITKPKELLLISKKKNKKIKL